MSVIETMKKLLLGTREKPKPTELIYVYLPAPLEPVEREDRYGDPLDAELQLNRLGYVSGGGSSLGAEQPDGSRRIESCGVDVDATDVAGARELLRRQLPLLGCPSGTQLQYRENGAPLQDEYDGLTWATGKPRDRMHPGFGV